MRLPLWLDKRNRLVKLMGSGRNGRFDIIPDLRQWALMVFREEPFPSSVLSDQARTVEGSLYGNAIDGWWRRLGCEVCTILLQVQGGHGTWDGKVLTTKETVLPTDAQPMAVLTRATIRWKRLWVFWTQLPAVSHRFSETPGLILSLGIGEVPLTRQATFSIWRSESDMKAFAYQSPEHRDVIARTRRERWYSEDMFLRFQVLGIVGSIRGENPWPLAGTLP